MRILHTSDLHWGMTLEGLSRQGDQERILDEILALCEQHDVDLLLVTGDVFHDRVPGAGGHVAAARRLLGRLVPELRRGRAVFLLRGNHDPLDLFQLMSLMLKELAGESHLPLVVASTPDIYSVPGHRVQVIALPYLTRGMVQAQAAEEEISPETLVAQLSGTLALALERLYSRVSPSVPAIFAGHIALRGANITEDREFESGYHRELWLEPARLPPFTSYNALGHIHLSQPVRGTAKPTWYAGTPDRLNLGERDYTPQVLLVDTPDTPGGTATVMPIPLTRCTPFVNATLEGEEAIERFCDNNWVHDPLGRITIGGIPVASRPATEAQVRRIAPRVRIFWHAMPTPEVIPSDGIDAGDVLGTATAFLQRAYADRPERRAQLEAALLSLWTEDTGETTA